MADVDPLPHGPKEALRGLAHAIERLIDANRQLLTGGGGGPVFVAMAESLFWVAALDEQGRKRGPSDYVRRRDAEPVGRTVGGLFFARNHHAHELVSTGEVAVHAHGLSAHVGPDLPPPGRGTIFSIQLRWAPRSALPNKDRRHPEKRDRDLMYDLQVAERSLTLPLLDALGWFYTIWS